MERGGWNLVFGWTNDAISNKNYSLLKEIFNLLMTTPVSVPRLKSNRFPIIIKNFSKDCEDEETKTLCKHVVSRWIGIAKSEEKGGEHSHIDHRQQPLLPSQSQVQEQLAIPADLDAATNATSTMNINTDHLLTIDPASVTAMLPTHEGVDGGVGNQALMDLDFSHTDLANIDLTGTDFASFDILNKMVVEGHNLEETISGGVIQHSQQQHQHQEIIIHNQQQQLQPSSAPISVIQHAPPPQHQLQHQQLIHMVPHQQQQIIYDPHQHLQQHQQVITHPQQQQQVMVTQNAPTQNIIHLTPSNVNVNAHPQIQVLHQPQQQQQQHLQQVAVPTSTPMTLVPVVQSQNQSPPKIFIKKVGGQTTVVQSFAGDSAITAGTAAPSVSGGGGQYCLVMKDGKNYLMRLKEQQNVVVTSTGNPVTSMAVQQQQGPPPQVPDSSCKVPPLVTQDNVDGSAGPVKKSKSPKKEPQIVSPVNKVPTDIQKTYSKTSSKEKDGKDKKSSDKDRDKDHHKDKKSSHHSSSSSSSHKKSKSSSSGGSSSASKAAAAAQAKKDKEEEEKRLSDKIRKEKALMKKRQKEAEKQKQQSDKDQETLKKLNLMSQSSSGGKIPKIPKRSQPGSFADAIGIPGGSEEKADKIKKVNSDKKDKTSDKEQTPPVTSSPTKKFYGKPEEETKEDDKPKERRHKAKVYVSSKSRSDDLVKEMEEGGSAGKSSSSKDKEKKEKDDKEQTNKSSVNLGNSIPATPPKISKRLSTDSLEKPGDAKKAKLEQEKQKEKMRKAQAAIVLKESSLFMDAISAGAESTKTGKKRRRASSGSDSKDVLPNANTPKFLEDDVMGSEQPSETPTTPEEDKKPVFNFYRDTLDDEDDNDSAIDATAASVESKGGEQGSAVKMEEDPSEAGSFTPQENDGKVKSALVLVRARNRPKKNVRWREEDELREFHFFEMDETERVNVTKQQKDFTELSCNEKLMERSFLKMRQEQDEEHGHLMQQKHQQQWKMVKIIFSTEILTPPVISTEKADQEEREKNVLGLFLPPGAILPDTALEPDVNMSDERAKEEPIQIPVEDVISITKVCDYRTHSWPEPKREYGMGMMIGGRGGYGGMPPRHFPPPPQQQSQLHPAQQTHHQFPGIPPLVVPNQILSPQQLQAPDYNPWSSNLGFSVPPPVGVPPPVSNPPDLVGGFASQFGGVNAATALTMNLGVPPPVAYPPNPFAFPPPAATALLNGGVGGSGIMDYGTNSNNNIGGRGGNGNNSHHRGGGSRFDNNDRRGGSGRDRDRSTSRDRDYRDDRGRDSRDKDYRRSDRSGSDRDYRNERDRNNRDFGRGPSGGGRNSKSS